MMKVKFVFCQGYSRNDDIVEILEFKDDEIDEIIEKEHHNWVWERLDTYWEKLNDQ